MIDLQQGKKWLVKSNSKLLGPFTADQVEELLRKKQISLIDEIRDMESRWQYLRENKFFAKVIDQVRKEIDSKTEVTKTIQTITQQSGTQTASHANTSMPIPIGSFTDIELPEKEAEILHEEATPAEVSRLSDSMSIHGTKKASYQNYVFEDDQKIVAKKKNITQKIWINIGLVVIAACGLAIGYYYYEKANLLRTEAKWISVFKKYKVQELDDQAIQVFLGLPADLQAKVLPQAIEFFPKFEAMGVLSTKPLIEKLKQYTLSIDEKVNLNLVYYLNYYYQHNLAKAEEELLKAKTIQPSSSLVKENIAILNFRNKKYMESYELFKELYSKENFGRYLLGGFFAIQQLSEEEKQKNLPHLKSLIDRHVSVNFDYKKELLAIQIYLTKIEQNTVLTELSLDEFFKTPCLLSRLFKSPALIPNDFYVWEGLNYFLDKSMDQLNNTNLQLFQIHRALEQGEISSLTALLDKLNNSTQEMSVKQHANLLINFYQSKYAEALIIEKTKQLDNKNSLNHLLLGLAKLRQGSNADINEHLMFLQELNEKFYFDWLKIMQLKVSKNSAQVRSYLVDHFLTQPSFIPALEAKAVLD